MGKSLIEWFGGGTHAHSAQKKNLHRGQDMLYFRPKYALNHIYALRHNFAVRQGYG
jgi:hypothetical protein